MKAKRLLGKEVLDVCGNRIGKAVDLDIDIVSGTINHIVVKKRLNKRHEIKPDDIATIGDAIILRTQVGKPKKKSRLDFLKM